MEARLKAHTANLRRGGLLWRVPARDHDKKTPLDVLLSQILEVIAHLNETSPVAAADFMALNTEVDQVQQARTRLENVMLEDYVRWMRPGNTSMPPVGQAMLFWGEHRDFTITQGCPAVSATLSPFANMLVTLSLLLSAGHRIAGSMHSTLQPLFAVMDHCADVELHAHILHHGGPGTNKSGTHKIIVASLISGTVVKNSGGGSARSMVFDDSAEWTIVTHDEPPATMQRAHANMSADGQTTSGMLQESMTSKVMSYPITTQRQNPGPDQRAYYTVVYKNKTPSNRLVASNMRMENPAMASRFIAIEARQPRGAHNTPIHKRMLVNLTEADRAKEAATTLISTFQLISMFVRVAISIRIIPPPSSVLFDLMMLRMSDLLRELGVPDADNMRKLNLSHVFHDSLVILNAIYIHYYSEASPRASMVAGEVVFGEVRFSPEDVVKLVRHFRDNEEVVLYCMMLRFNELVNPFDYHAYGLLFTDVLHGARFNPDQLAAWVRYVAYMEFVTQPKDKVDVVRDLPYFKIFGPDDERSAYAFGVLTGVLAAVPDEPFLTMATEPAGLDSAEASDHWARVGITASVTGSPCATPRAPAYRTSMPQAQYRGGSGSYRAGGLGPRKTVEAYREPTFQYDGTTYNWNDLHPGVRKYVPEKPEPIFKRDSGIRLWCEKPSSQAENADRHVRASAPANELVEYDPNYAMLAPESMAALARDLARIMRDDDDLGWTGDEASIKCALGTLENVSIRSHRLKHLRLQPHQGISEEAFARCFLRKNIEEAPSYMRVFRTREAPGSHVSKKPRTEIYVLTPLSMLSYVRLRQRVLNLFQHRGTRERDVPLGPNPWSNSAEIEMYQLSPSPLVTISLDIKDTANLVENEMLPKVMACKLPKPPSILPAGSPLQDVERAMSISMGKLTINGDIEKICSRQFCLENGIDDRSLPVNIENRIRAFYKRHPESKASKDASSYNYRVQIDAAAREEAENDLMNYNVDTADCDDAEADKESDGAEAYTEDIQDAMEEDADAADKDADKENINASMTIEGDTDVNKEENIEDALYAGTGYGGGQAGGGQIGQTSDM